MDILSLSSVAHLADIEIDSTGRAPDEFRRELLSRLGLPNQDDALLTIQSFSYKKGLPESADYVFDMRFLNNPHWQGNLREKTGLDDAVRSFVEADPRFSSFMERVTGLIAETLPSQTGDGRPNVTVAFGCTGGKHRSPEHVAGEIGGQPEGLALRRVEADVADQIVALNARNEMATGVFKDAISVCVVLMQLIGVDIVANR